MTTPSSDIRSLVRLNCLALSLAVVFAFGASLAAADSPAATPSASTSKAAAPVPARNITPVDAESDSLRELARQLATSPAAVASTPIAGSTAKSPAPAVPPAPVAGSPLPTTHTPLGPSSSKLGPNSATAKGTWGDMWWLSTIVALAAVVALILVLKAAITKWTGRTPASAHNPAIEVLSRVLVAPRNHVLLLRLGHRILVVGDSPTGLRTLANIRDPEEVARLLASVSASAPGSATASFNQLIKGFDEEADLADRADAPTQDSSEYHIDRARDGVSGLLSRIRSVRKGGPA